MLNIWNLLGSLASMVSLLLMLAAADKNNPILTAVAFAFALFFVFYLIANNLWLWAHPPVEYHTDFRKYCVLCATMAKKAKQFIYTIQTPATINAMKAQDLGKHYFERYLRTTAKKILKTDRNGKSVLHAYCRLIVVEKNTIDSEKEKIDLFLKFIKEELLLIYSSKWHRLLRFFHFKEVPKLNAVEVGVIHADIVAQRFFSNLDVHITGENSYVFAFQKKGVNNGGVPETNWKGSLHTNDVRGDELRHRIHDLYTDIWPTADVRGNGKKISFATYFENLAVDNWKTELNNCINALKDNINVAIEEVGNAVP